MYQKMIEFRHAVGLVDVSDPGVEKLADIMSGKLTDIISEQTTLITKQARRIMMLEKKLARLEHEQKIDRAAMPFGGA